MKTRAYAFRGGPLDGEVKDLRRATGRPTPKYCKNIDGVLHWYRPTNDGLMIYEGAKNGPQVVSTQ